ncbi:hypothetical protein LTR93_012223 [Exophiala xenobiotica]|nr:hypothetical protein LTR93_012223 [Exophiala xenobiotica]
MDQFADEQEPLLSAPTPKTYPQPVKTFDVGIIDADGYGEVSGFQHEAKDDDHTLKTTTGIAPTRRKRVIIVGAGVSGIQQATTLLRGGKVKHEDMAIFDALDGYGGVWQKNKYPGCACDVPALLYTTSYFINKEYTHFYATREQIQAYYTRFAETYKLDKCTQFQSFVKSCSWDENEMVWNVGIVKKRSGTVEHWVADAVIQCVGALDRPKFGNLPGRETYRGVSWHTAHWRHDYDLSGKRVGIIGCGPSVSQIISEIVDKVDHVTIYMRTPPVCLPRGDFAFSRLYR